MRYTYRIGDCKELGSGENSSSCVPATDIVVPLVGTVARLEEIARGALNSPTSLVPGYEWRSKSITTTGFLRFRERETMVIEHLGEKITGVILGSVRINQASPTEFTQDFTVWYLIPSDNSKYLFSVIE